MAPTRHRLQRGTERAPDRGVCRQNGACYKAETAPVDVDDDDAAGTADAPEDVAVDVAAKDVVEADDAVAVVPKYGGRSHDALVAEEAPRKGDGTQWDCDSLGEPRSDLFDDLMMEGKEK